ncbi:MAG: hypothetical protein J2P36_16135 [Ktedonobacteraceae bacterium]|nr:hypothetical protein [Ktedonobacteraceae bacterium]
MKLVSKLSQTAYPSGSWLDFCHDSVEVYSEAREQPIVFMLFGACCTAQEVLGRKDMKNPEHISLSEDRSGMQGDQAVGVSGSDHRPFLATLSREMVKADTGASPVHSSDSRHQVSDRDVKQLLEGDLPRDPFLVPFGDHGDHTKRLPGDPALPEVGTTERYAVLLPADPLMTDISPTMGSQWRKYDASKDDSTLKPQDPNLDGKKGTREFDPLEDGSDGQQLNS